VTAPASHRAVSVTPLRDPGGMTTLTFTKRSTHHACSIGGICYDGAGVANYTEASLRFKLPRQPVWRCPDAHQHADHPYHTGPRPKAGHPRAA
jgi:hypothetical protein